MTRTLLVDLDNTLLHNENAVFIPALVRAFARFASDLINPEELPAMFLLGTQAMIENRRPDRLLIEVLEEDFASRSGHSKEVLRERVTTFYTDVFPGLKELTAPVPEALDFVREAEKRNYSVALSTNPLYPRNAIEQRLEWAGLNKDRFRPEVITSFEDFHFTKPSPAYFAEILARLNWPESEVIVIGDDPVLDIEPAGLFGVRSFEVRLNHANGDTVQSTRMAGKGGLMDFFPWLDRTNGSPSATEYETPAALQAVLRSTPAAIDSLLRNASGSMLDYRYDENEWNITEVICHLRDVEREVRLPRVRQVLDEDNPLIAGKSTDEWADERGYCFQNPELAFREFVNCRMETLSLIEDIGPEAWQRPARHTIFGPTDLQELVSIAASHDRMHLRQVGQLERDYSKKQR